MQQAEQSRRAALEAGETRRLITTSARYSKYGTPESSGWLIKQLRRNSQEKFSFGNYDLSAYPRFYYQVKSGGPNDFKRNTLKPYAESGISLFGQQYNYDVPGNIVYGYLGRTYGFSEEALRNAAGFAHVQDKTGGIPLRLRVKWPPGPIPIRLGEPLDRIIGPNAKKHDDPLDQHAIGVGFQLYESQDLSRANVRRAIKAAKLRPAP
jgi:hypothetical protein